MSVADQYNAGEFESAPESSLILSIKFVWRPDVETVCWKPRNEQVKCHVTYWAFYAQNKYKQKIYIWIS